MISAATKKCNLRFSVRVAGKSGVNSKRKTYLCERRNGFLLNHWKCVGVEHEECPKNNLEKMSMKKTVILKNYLEEVFPICIDKDGFVINLAGMEKHSPTGDSWGYAPFQKAYKTKKEAEMVRKELWKTIKRWVNYYD